MMKMEDEERKEKRERERENEGTGGMKVFEADWLTPYDWLACAHTNQDRLD